MVFSTAILIWGLFDSSSLVLTGLIGIAASASRLIGLKELTSLKKRLVGLLSVLVAACAILAIAVWTGAWLLGAVVLASLAIFQMWRVLRDRAGH